MELLPKEIIINICELLSYDDICNYRLACKYYKMIISFKRLSQNYWKNNVLYRIKQTNDYDGIESNIINLNEWLKTSLDDIPIMTYDIRISRFYYPNTYNNFKIPKECKLYKINIKDKENLKRLPRKYFKMHNIIFDKKVYEDSFVWYIKDWYLLFKTLINTQFILKNNYNKIKKYVDSHINDYGVKNIYISICIPFSIYYTGIRIIDDILLSLSIYGGSWGYTKYEIIEFNSETDNIQEIKKETNPKSKFL